MTRGGFAATWPVTGGQVLIGLCPDLVVVDRVQMVDVAQHHLIRVLHVGRVFKGNRSGRRLDLVTEPIVRVVGAEQQQSDTDESGQQIEEQTTNAGRSAWLQIDRFRIGSQACRYVRSDHEWIRKDAQAERVAGFNDKLIQLARIQIDEFEVRRIGCVAH